MEQSKASGTLKDYSEDMYKVYFEIGEYDGVALTILTSLIGKHHADNISTLEFGYELALPIQVIPEAVRLMSEANIAIYQIIRGEKTDDKWREQ